MLLPLAEREFVHPVGGMRADTDQDISQVGKRVHAVQFTRDDQAEQNGQPTPYPRFRKTVDLLGWNLLICSGR